MAHRLSTRHVDTNFEIKKSSFWCTLLTYQSCCFIRLPLITKNPNNREAADQPGSFQANGHCSLVQSFFKTTSSALLCLTRLYIFTCFCLQAIVDGLEGKNHKVDYLTSAGAVVQAIVSYHDGLKAQSDPRKFGYAAGY